MTVTVYTGGASVDVIVNAVPAPSIANATALPSTLPAGGGAVTINATVSNATQVTLDGAVVTLPTTVNITAAHTFVLVAHGQTAPDAQVSLPVSVTVPQTVVPTINLQPFQGTSGGLDALIFWRYTTYNRYERNESLLAIPSSGGSLRMIGVKMFNGAAVSLAGASITVTLAPANNDFTFGAPITLPAVTVSTGSEANIPTPTLAPGWYRLTAVAGTRNVPAYWAYVPGGAHPTVMPVIRANWEMEHPAGGGTVFTAADALVPAVFAPTMVPYPARVFENTTATPSRSTCVETQLVPCRAPDIYRISYASMTSQQPEGGAYTPRLAGVAGVPTTANRQAYNYFDLIGREVPMIPLLDGPRGMGNVFCAQHLWVGRNGKVFFTDNWRFGVIKTDGTVTTLAGWRHKTPTLWTDLPQDLELVGDWSRVAGAKSINRSWGYAFDARSTVTDPNAPPVNGVQPHVGIGPVGYMPDYNHNRILKHQFNGGGVAAIPVFGDQNAGDPCIVTEWISSAEPFECVTDGTNRLFVSERAANRVAIYNMDDASLITLFTMPTQYPFPEGLFYQDGALYYACVSTDSGGQLTGGQIRKRTDGGADSLVLQLTTPWIIDNNSRFAKFGLSDGTFGPRGMLHLNTWSGNGYGYPLLFLPNGTKVSDSTFPGQPYPGPGLPWKVGSAYPVSSAIGLGRMVCSTMQEGIRVISKAQPTDTNLATAGYLAGRDDWYQRGFNLTNGDDGYGLYGVAQRWGVTPQIDEYLTAQGHVRA